MRKLTSLLVGCQFSRGEGKGGDDLMLYSPAEDITLWGGAPLDNDKRGKGSPLLRLASVCTP